MRPDQPELIARLVGAFQAGLFVSTAYLDKAGRSKTPAEAAEHSCLDNPAPDPLLAPARDLGIPLRPEIVVMSSENGPVMWERLRADLGISVHPDLLCDAAPSLERVLPEFPRFLFPT